MNTELLQKVRQNPALLEISKHLGRFREIFAQGKRNGYAYGRGETYALGALPRLLWVKDKMPEVYEKIAAVGMFNDWLIYKLTGVEAVEPSRQYRNSFRLAVKATCHS